MNRTLFFTVLFSLLSWNCSDTDARAEDNKLPTEQSAIPAAIQVETTVLPIDTIRFDLNYIMGKFDPVSHPDFVPIPAKYADRAGRYLHKETFEAFLKMWEAAQADGIQLRIISATRNFEVQKGIWEAKWSGSRQVSGQNLSRSLPNPAERALKILEYSSMPGTSRHHWGTDIDLNALDNSHFEKGAGLKTYEWLMVNANKYGFCQPYSPKGSERPDGYNEEKWHWSYLPIAQLLTNQARLQLKNDMIEGFKGAETATQIDVVNKYVLGINRDCL